MEANEQDSTGGGINVSHFYEVFVYRMLEGIPDRGKCKYAGRNGELEVSAAQGIN